MIPVKVGNRPGERETKMRWFNPRLKRFEWRSVPEGDEEALRLLGGLPEEQAVVVEAYKEWRWLGASVMAALIRAGEAVQRVE